jgi:ribosome maturation factor RimP
VIERRGGVDLDSISLVTRLVSRELDHADPIAGRYTLEVSSPGLERVLRTPEHFARVLGRTVAIRTHAGVDGDRRVHGTLRTADERGVVVVLDEPPLVERRLAYDEIERARTVFVWAAAPKPGKGPRAAGPARRVTARSAAAPEELDDDRADGMPDEMED